MVLAVVHVTHSVHQELLVVEEMLDDMASSHIIHRLSEHCDN